MMRPAAIVFCLLFLGGFVLSGCGGGGGAQGDKASSSSEPAGQAAFTVRWPEPSRLIPFASNSIKVQVMRGDAFLGERLLVRPAGGGETSAIFERLSTGDAVATATAYPNAGGTGVAQASAQVTFTIVGGQTTNLRLTMNSTIDRIEIAPSAPLLPVGQSVALAATAKNAAGEVVLIAAENLRWRSLDSAVAAVDVAGKVTAKAQGSTSIEATETESGKAAAVSIGVTSGDLTGGQVVFNPANGHYYQAVSVPAGITWDAARTAATSGGGYLATITSAAENQFVFSLIDAPRYWVGTVNGNLGPWIGGYRQPSGLGPFRWVTEEPFSYTNWNPGQPDTTQGIENCLQYYHGVNAPRAPTWNDLPGNYTLYGYPNPRGYIIEWESNPNR